MAITTAVKGKKMQSGIAVCVLELATSILRSDEERAKQLELEDRTAVVKLAGMYSPKTRLGPADLPIGTNGARFIVQFCQRLGLTRFLTMEVLKSYFFFLEEGITPTVTAIRDSTSSGVHVVVEYTVHASPSTAERAIKVHCTIGEDTAFLCSCYNFEARRLICRHFFLALFVFAGIGDTAGGGITALNSLSSVKLTELVDIAIGIMNLTEWFPKRSMRNEYNVCFPTMLAPSTDGYDVSPSDADNDDRTLNYDGPARLTAVVEKSNQRRSSATVDSRLLDILNAMLQQVQSKRHKGAEIRPFLNDDAAKWVPETFFVNGACSVHFPHCLSSLSCVD